MVKFDLDYVETIQHAKKNAKSILIKSIRIKYIQ